MQFPIFYTQYDLFEEIKTGLSEGLFFNKKMIFAKRAQNIKMIFLENYEHIILILKCMTKSHFNFFWSKSLDPIVHQVYVCDKIQYVPGI